MSQPGKPVLESNSLNKPDFQELNLGSPVSPLNSQPRGLTTTTTSTSSSSSSSGSITGRIKQIKSNPVRTNQSGSIVNNLKNTSLLSSATSPATTNILPTGNICPSGKIQITQNRPRTTDVLGFGTGTYGHGNIMRSNTSPTNASYRSNRAASLIGLGRIGEAVKECEEAVRSDPNYVRARHRLALLFIRLGEVNNARKHLLLDPIELRKLQVIEKYLNKCEDARRISDWKTVLIQVEAAIASGADFSPKLVMCKVEALLKLNRLDDAQSILVEVPKVVPFPVSCSQSRFCNMLCEAYTYFVKAEIEMALGRFENAVTAVEKATQIDPQSNEVAMLCNSVTLVARARVRGNDLYKSERYTEASSAYTEGLRLDPNNAVLYCNRAACWFKLGMWERSVEDCNQALRFQPSYTKPLLRRAASNSKLERWEAAVSDYQVLRKELPHDKEVAEFLFHSQIALKKSRGEEVSNMEFCGKVEEIYSREQFKAAMSLSGVSVIHFSTASDHQCKQISPIVDSLCTRYPSIHFLKVDIDKCPSIGNAENVRVVPTVKIYNNGTRVKEIVCPSKEVLELSVKHYSG